MRRHPGAGIWELFVPGLGEGSRYKFEILGQDGALLALKADPFAFEFEVEEPRTASVVASLDGYAWGDGAWTAERARRNALDAPDLDLRGPPGLVAARARGGEPVPHLPGARRGARGLRPRPRLHPRGAPADRRAPLLRIVGLPADRRLRADPPVRDGDGVHGLRGRAPPPRDRRHPRLGAGPLSRATPTGSSYFDGTHLYEHADPRRREQADWGTLVFNYGRHEVANYLIGNALYWLDAVPPGRAAGRRRRLDALPRLLQAAGRVAAERHGGQREPGGDRLPPAFNEVVYRYHPAAMTIAEESTSWPMVSRPIVRRRARVRVQVEHGLDARRPRLHGARSGAPEVPPQPAHLRAAVRLARELRAPAVPRRGGPRQGLAPSARCRATTGRGSPGSARSTGSCTGTPARSTSSWAGSSGRRASGITTRASTGTSSTRGRTIAGSRALVRDLNRVYRAEPALHQVDFEPAGFQWMDCSDAEQSVVAFVRRARDPRDFVLVVCNFTPVPRRGYRSACPPRASTGSCSTPTPRTTAGATWATRAASGRSARPWTGQPWSVTLTLPPLGVVMLKPGARLIYSGRAARTTSDARRPRGPIDAARPRSRPDPRRGQRLASRAPDARAQQARGAVRRALPDRRLRPVELRQLADPLALRPRPVHVAVADRAPPHRVADERPGAGPLHRRRARRRCGSGRCGSAAAPTPSSRTST